jgi:hypothetical protein
MWIKVDRSLKRFDAVLGRASRTAEAGAMNVAQAET